MSTSATLSLRVGRVRQEAQGIRRYELLADGGALPRFEAGAHLDLHLQDGLKRSYSICNAPSETNRYEIAVLDDPASRGGSRFVHQALHEGVQLTASVPRNNFPLVEQAPHTLMIAGGIGITPFRAMVHRLQILGQAWTLHYCARTRQHAAFVEELQQLAASGQGQLHLHFDLEPGGAPLDIAQQIASADENTHLYCCGPGSMLDAFERACSERPPTRVHRERFAAATPVPSIGKTFEIVLARQGRTLKVLPNKSILETVLEAGIDVPYSCFEGVCGACETEVLEGCIQHRDTLLSEDERAAGDRMMICCSTATSPSLVLDL
ncbi:MULTISPECIES: PDR/VanB family oxidoreductase [Comamonadaceae]|uniref:PDR/VanB family oxidoreductase n=1 Tax=Comamonadaceae TaxID=80864 RepID=UPI0010F96585|nr:MULTISPECIES: PDR/VanB family oxidoreductase [Comamonadaceae]